MHERKNLIIRLLIFVLSIALSTSITSAENIIYVDPNGSADYSTIQAAIDAAVDGDTILVAPGTYTGDGNRDIDFKGKAITVKSKYGSNTCIINCQGSPGEYHRGFYFHNDEDANSVVQGFTIINGYATRGGGIFCESASPHILDCLITENTAFESGGGIQCEYSNPTIKRCFIEKNSADYGGGVGIGSTGSISSMLTITNCLITGNKAMRSGGGICCIGKVNFSNCTVIGNSAGIEGGGISFLLVVGERINNSILYGNMSSTGSEIAIITPAPGLAGCGEPLLKITNSVVGSDPNDIYFTHCNGYLYGEWLQADPLFANPGFWDANGTLDDPNDDFWVKGDYHLKSQAGRWDPDSQSWVVDDVTSPCIDAGDPNSPVGLEPEPNGGRINMGAYGGTDQASKSYLTE
jgi:predicted outer membrane repeat protein